MFTSKTAQFSFLTLLVGVTSVMPLNPALAQDYRTYGDSNNDYQYLSGVIEGGTTIPVTYSQKTIQIEPNETVPLTLKVARSIRDRNGSVIIPSGSEIEGQLEPVGQGVRYTATRVKINNGEWISLNATSSVVGRTETVKIGASTADIVKGTLAGAGTATVIAGTTGDRRIDALEVLAGAAVGTLAGWGLPEAGIIGGGTKEVVVVNPSQDLTLTVQSSLGYDDSYRQTQPNYPSRYPDTAPNNGRRWYGNRGW